MSQECSSECLHHWLSPTWTAPGHPQILPPLPSPPLKLTFTRGFYRFSPLNLPSFPSFSFNIYILFPFLSTSLFSFCFSSRLSFVQLSFLSLTSLYISFPFFFPFFLHRLVSTPSNHRILPVCPLSYLAIFPSLPISSPPWPSDPLLYHLQLVLSFLHNIHSVLS